MDGNTKPPAPGAEITQQVIAQFEQAPDPRLRQIMTSLVSHLHGWIRDVEPTENEWMTALMFLTRTGQISDAERQEFILLSDILGVSILVDLINHRSRQNVTDSTVLGPFFVEGVEVQPMGTSVLKAPEKMEPIHISGTVTDENGDPVEGARIDTWQAASNGLYDNQDPDVPRGHLRGAFITGKDGRYSLITIAPHFYPVPVDGPVGELLAATGRHPNRPAHIHFMIRHDGFDPLVTHLFDSACPYLQNDVVFAMKDDLVMTPTRDAQGKLTVQFDFGLRPVGEGRLSEKRTLHSARRVEA